MRRIFTALGALLVAVGAAAPAAALPDPPPSDVTAVATLDKTASETEISPGETFTYTLTVGCSSITDTGCKNAVLSDVVPAPFVVVEAVVGGGVNSAAEPVVDGNRVTVDWTTPLGDGTVGILDNTTAVVEITARLPADVSHDADGVPVVNDAVIEGTNFVDDPAQVAVTPAVPLGLSTSPTKVLDPASVIASPGNPVGATLTASNDSNATVDTLRIQDPVDPTASPNPFEYLAFTGLGPVTPPEGTSQTAYQVFVGGAWVDAPGGTLPGGVDPAAVGGARVTFAGAIPAGASASVTLGLETSELAAAQPDGFVVTDTVQSQVTLGGDAATGQSSDDLTLRANDIAVGASKTFDPDLVVAGDSSTVTLGATNESAIALDSLTLREPSSGSFPDAYAFAGFSSGVAFPAGATSGRVVYRLAGGGTETVAFTDGAMPGPPAVGPADVTSFEIVFEGDIAPGAETAVQLAVDTDPDAQGLPLAVPDEVAVDGVNDGATGTATASDDLFVYDEVIDTYVGKRLRPSRILAVPGETVTVSLSGGLTERPDPPGTPAGSTGDAAQIVISDPANPVVPDDWWNAFDVTAVTQTPVPADSTLTVEYYDTTDGTWKTLTGPVAGPAIYSAPVPEAVSAVAGGIRFVYDHTGDQGGFPPGTDLAPNFTSELRPEGRYQPGPPFDDAGPSFVPDCAQTDATGTSPDVAGAHTEMPTADCPELELVPPDPGNADLVDKAYGTSSSGGTKSVIARSGDTIPSALRWSTGGFSGFGHLDVTDVADPDGTAVADSVYDAFDLTRVQPITTATDPLVRYDQVQQVLLWNGASWVDAANDPCPAGCVGRFPGMNLTTAEQRSTLGVRLVFVESPDRAAASQGDLDAPPVGSGVARSFDNDRQITLVWRVRDARRSDGGPVLGEDVYNLTDPGVVRNTVNATGYPAGGGTPVSANDDDDVVIVDVPLTTTTDKNWSGGPLSVPTDPGVPANQYPLSRLSVTTRNTTPARVDHLVVTDPAPGSTTDRRRDPFQAFLLNAFVAIDQPAGTQSTEVTLFCPDGSAPTYTRSEALALRPATLPCDVTGFQVAFDGRIAANAAGVVTADLRLRPAWRGTGELVTPADSPIFNTAEGVVADIDDVTGCPPPAGTRAACDSGTASITLEVPSFSVTAGKTIVPAGQSEGDFSPVTVTLSGRNGGSARAVSEVLTDDDPSFWNAVDFVGIDPSWTLPTPIGAVQACYLAGGDFTAAAVEVGSVGGDWTCQPVEQTSLADAVAFLAAAPATLHGLRFTFRQANGLGWSNPSNPLIQVPFLVRRREELRTGGPVPTTRSDQVPAPGEAEAGVFHDTVEVDGSSVQIGPGQILTAHDEATDEYRHLHLEAAVSVQKSPTGDVRPGRVIPFRLAFTNTGDAPLTNPVFTDELPTDAQGRQLVFDPDRDPSVSPYTFALAGAAPDPPNGTALPTDPDAVDVTTVGDTIVFGMPDGSVLEPGQTYTITIELMLRPGLTPADDVRNWATIDADEPFDDCVRVLDPQTGVCRDDAVVSPLAVPALSTVKLVRADQPVDEPGVPRTISMASGFSCDGAADADGFYRAPCVPVTLPGDTETWRFRVTNAGTLPMDRLVSIDNLPVPGDQGLIVTLPRESQWPPTFAGGVELVAGPPGATLTTFYSTQSVPCTADLNPLGPACAPGAWLPLDDSVDPGDVRSVKLAVDFPEGALFQPGQQVTLQLRTRTTPETAVDDGFPKAWDTVSTGGAARAAGRRIVVPGTEGRRVGVAYPTGPVRLQKVVSGPGASFAPDQFPVRLRCTSAGNELTGLPEAVLEPGADPTLVDGLPWGAECTATEGDNGQTSTVIGTATVGGPEDEVGLVRVENVFATGGLEVTKTVTTSAVDQDGDPVPYGPFEVAVTCEYLGEPVFADGYDQDTPMAHRIEDAETWALAGLPAGASCSVAETDDAGATATVVRPSDTVEVQPGGPTAVEVENAFSVGSLALHKVVEGEGADDFGAGPFTLHVACTLQDASGSRPVYDADVLLGGDQPLDRTVDDLAAGAVCTVTEPDAAGAQDVATSPGAVTVGAGETAAVTVTNTFETGALTVVKQVRGPGAERYGAGPFQVTLGCTREGVDGEPVELAVPGGATRELTSDTGYTATYQSLLVGAVCTLEESRTGGATHTEILDQAGDPLTELTVTDQDPPAVARVVNTFDVGAVRVTKTISGAGAAAADDRRFTVLLACTRDVDGTAEKVAVPGGARRVLSRETTLSARYRSLPAGAACTLTEPRSGRADGTAITPNEGDRSVGVVTVAPGAAVDVDVVNHFGPGPPNAGPPDAGPPDAGPPSDGGSSGGLPDTGLSRATQYAAVTALLLLLVGGGLVALGRRSSEK